MTPADARANGITRWGLQRARADGSLRRIGRGVYQVVGDEPDPVLRWLRSARAVLALAGADAVLARASAAALWRLDGFDSCPVPIELNAPRRSTGERRVRVRRSVPLEPPDRVDALPVTAVGQTLVELGSTGTESSLDALDRVELAVECALHRRLIGITALAELAAAAGARRGSPVLRAVLERRPVGAPPTESYLETRMVQLLRRHGLPEPQRQVEIRDDAGFVGRVDLLVGPVVIELHGGQHNGAAVLDADRLRRARLEAAGYRVLGFGYLLVIERPAFVAGIVRDTLTQAAGHAHAGGLTAHAAGRAVG